MIGTKGSADLTCTSELLASFLRCVAASSNFRRLLLDLAAFLPPTVPDIRERIFTDEVKLALGALRDFEELSLKIVHSAPTVEDTTSEFTAALREWYSKPSYCVRMCERTRSFFIQTSSLMVFHRVQRDGRSRARILDG